MSPGLYNFSAEFLFHLIHRFSNPDHIIDTETVLPKKHHITVKQVFISEAANALLCLIGEGSESGYIDQTVNDSFLSIPY